MGIDAVGIIRKKFLLITGIICVAVISGCASPRLIPIADGGMINPERQSSTKLDDGVKVTVQASAWDGRPSGLERYVTPIYITVENDTEESLTFSYDDIALFDAERTQYNPIPPETVAQIVQADDLRRISRTAFSSSFFFGRGFFRSPFFASRSFIGSPFFFDPFFPRFIPPSPRRVEDIFNMAISPGVLRPNAKLRGFVYFTELPAEEKSVTFEIAYKLRGDKEPSEIRFPFAVELKRP